jgi:flagellar biosynthesis chaperone FliJ
MTYYDHGAAMYDKKCEEKYEEFKEKLRASKSEDDEMLYRHIIRLEGKATNRNAKLIKYQNFFQTLQELLPKQSSIHDVLG